MLASKAISYRNKDKLAEAIEVNYVYETLYRYNSIPRYLLIKRLKEAQKLLYK
nr:MAG TPA: hypothetical protein [Crassvirales sp.]